ncbi:hypothetical protein TNCV_4145471 [Trichonephila clavipes]|nr:hypothetical protein TNCV_4145471 [Trichonephila clavipes]
MDKCVQMLDKELWRLGPDSPAVLACYAQIGQGRPRDFCDLPIRRDEGRVVNTSLVFKRVLFEETSKRRERREREKSCLGGRKGKSPALDGESMRGEPWLERGREESAKEKGLV